MEHEFFKCGGETAAIMFVVAKSVVPWFEEGQVVFGVSLLEGPSRNVMETKELSGSPFIVDPVLVYIMIQVEMR